MPQAEQICRHVLIGALQNAPAWHLLGVIAYQVGNYEAAVEQIARAVQLAPTTFGAHSNLGLALHAQQKLDDAFASYQRALALKPDSETGA